MKIERLVAMANDIAAFFETAAEETAAVESVAQHLRRFWDPRMRCEITAHLQRGGAGLSPLARAGVARLAG